MKLSKKDKLLKIQLSILGSSQLCQTFTDVGLGKLKMSTIAKRILKIK